MKDENKIELLKKLKELADRGVGGEKINAQRKLEFLMAKYEITYDDITDDIVKDFEYKIDRKKTFMEKLFAQTAYSVYGDINDNRRIFAYVYNKNKRLGITCTTSEFIEITAKFEFYKIMLEQDLELFYSAFIQNNKLFPPDSKTNPRNMINVLDDEGEKILKMMSVMDSHTYFKQIGGVK